MEKVYCVECENYDVDNISRAFELLFNDNDLLSFIKPGLKVAIKTNLVAASKPESATTTHFQLVKKLCAILVEKGCEVVVGDSPGGLYNDSFLSNIYNKTRIIEIEETGAKVNRDFGVEQRKINGKVVKILDCCKYLLDADVVINFAKIKSHGMLSLSSATKNMFGSVPGTNKLEYHYKYPNHQDFGNMLIDIQQFYKPVLHLVDAIDGMEGNGPTMGTPRHIGLLLASKNCFELDLICCKLMNLDPKNVVYLQNAINDKLCSQDINSVETNINIDKFIVADFKMIEHPESIEFVDDKKSKLISNLLRKILQTKPNVNKKNCIGCKKCFNICPAKAITMKDGKPNIDRKKCIRCFCCQEFCPVGAMETKRSFIAKMLNKK